MAGVTGDFGKLRHLIGDMRQFKNVGCSRVTQQMAAQAESNVHRCFETSTDPNGIAWLPLKKRRGMPLLDTRRLDSSITSRVTGLRFVIETSVVYAATHNYGDPSRGIPKRQFIPSERMPVLWEMELRHVAALTVVEMFN